MWDKPHLLHMVSSMLFGISFALVLYGALHYTLHLPVFSLRALQLSVAPRQVDTAQIGAVVRNEVRGNFFTVDLDKTRRAFEKLPWVRKVSVRRHFAGWAQSRPSQRPSLAWQLELVLEEHEALARWNETELVNTHGEVFAAACERVMPEAAPRPDEGRVSDGTVSQSTRLSHNANQVAGYGGVPLAGTSGTHRPPPCGETNQVLPRFFGQPDSAAEVTQMYKAFGEQLAPLKQEIVQISLSPRRAWQLRLANGMVLELGSEQSQQRLARFVAVYPYSLAPLQQGYGDNPLSADAGKDAHENGRRQTVKYVDLRYRNGFAVYLAGGVKAVKGET